MRLFPFVWTTLTIALGVAVLVATWLDVMVQISWFDDSQFSYPDGFAAVWPDPILAAIGLSLVIGGAISTSVVINKIIRPARDQAANQLPVPGWPRIWIMITIGLGAAVFMMPILETVAFDRFYTKHAIGTVSVTVFPAVFISRFRLPGIGRRR